MTHFKGFLIKFILWNLFMHNIMSLTVQNAQKFIRPAATAITARNLYQQYSLGQVEDGAKIIYTYQKTLTFDTVQQEISLDFNYPHTISDTEETFIENDVNNGLIITQIQLYVKAQDGSETQAYVTEGGIGKRSLSLKIVALNSSLLNYMLIIYGKAIEYNQ